MGEQDTENADTTAGDKPTAAQLRERAARLAREAEEAERDARQAEANERRQARSTVLARTF